MQVPTSVSLFTGMRCVRALQVHILHKSSGSSIHRMNTQIASMSLVLVLDRLPS